MEVQVLRGRPVLGILLGMSATGRAMVSRTVKDRAGRRSAGAARAAARRAAFIAAILAAFFAGCPWPATAASEWAAVSGAAGALFYVCGKRAAPLRRAGRLCLPLSVAGVFEGGGGAAAGALAPGFELASGCVESDRGSHLAFCREKAA